MLNLLALVIPVLVIIGGFIGYLLRKHQDKMIIKKVFEAGRDIGKSEGYDLAWQLRRIDNNNRGIIIGSKVDDQLARILKENGF